jgi:hypothetical protein
MDDGRWTIDKKRFSIVDFLSSVAHRPSSSAGTLLAYKRFVEVRQMTGLSNSKS